MAYGSLLTDTVQSSTTGTPPQFNDGSGTQVGTLCRAWVNFNGSTAARTGSFNVSSVTRASTGVYTISMTNALPDTAYAVVGTAGQSTANIIGSPWTNNGTITSSSFFVSCVNYTGSYTDQTTISITVFR